MTTHPKALSINALEVAKACIARWHDTTKDNVIENIMTTDVADIIQQAIDEATVDLRAQLAEAKSANESLMNERTSYIATARDNYARLESKLAQANTVIAERDAQLAAADKALTEKLTIHSFNTTQLPDGRYVIVHPEIPPHIWDGQTFQKIEVTRQPTQDKG